MLDLETRALEFLCKKEEELARIIDQKLTPRRLIETHVRYPPIKLKPRIARAVAEIEGLPC